MTLPSPRQRRDFTVDVDVDDWPDGVHTPVDALLFSAARELLSNVVKHAGASRASIAVGLYGDSARLVVTDDGKGITDGARNKSLEAGHIGLHSQRLRIEAAGGTLTVVGRIAWDGRHRGGAGQGRRRAARVGAAQR